MARRWGGFRPYQSAAARRAKAQRYLNRERKAGREAQPVVIEGRTIAHTFWGKAWCSNLEQYSDYESRLPRGRSYARNGSVVDLKVQPGRVEARVLGSDLYAVTINIAKLPARRWSSIVKGCSGQVGSLLSLLRGELSPEVMDVVTRPKEGLFPFPGEIEFDCTCPDWAYMCKHVAAVLYGIGARLDRDPAQLFALRGVDPAPLIEEVVAKSPITNTPEGRHKRLANVDLSSLFGLPIEDRVSAAKQRRARRAARKK